MTSARARLGASVGLALAATLLPATSAWATVAPDSSVVGTTTVSRPAAETAVASTTTAATVALPRVGRTGRVALSREVMSNPVLRGRVVVLVAKRYAGIRYVAGGTRPSTGFDCSGYTKWVFSQVGISLPRVSRSQYAWSRHIPLSQAVPGDLVFFHHHGRVYHAAIYAGHGRVWHSPHTGSRVKLERIWTSSFFVGRVRA